MTAVAVDDPRAPPAAPEVVDASNPSVLAAGGEVHQGASVEEVVGLVAGLGHVEEGVNASRG